MRNDNVVEKKEESNENLLEMHTCIIGTHMIFDCNGTEMFKVFDISIGMKSWFIAVDLCAFESHVPFTYTI